MKTIKIAILAFVSVQLLAACEIVKPYQSQFINDYYMEQGPLSVDKAEIEGFNYREGSSGGDGGKVGGGCGCN